MKNIDYWNIKTYQEFIDYFVLSFRQNKTNYSKLKSIDAFQFIGIYCTMVSQMELKIFNDFIDQNNLIRKQTNRQTNFLWQGLFSQPWRWDERQEYLIKNVGVNKQIFDIKKFGELIQLNNNYIKKTGDDLISGYWNKYITKIINLNIKSDFFKTFKSLRNYRHELVHQVDDYEIPFGNHTNNNFKEKKTIIDIKKLLYLSWKLKPIDNSSFIYLNEQPSIIHSKFLIENAPTIGFILLYNHHETQNQLTIADLTLKKENIIFLNWMITYKNNEKYRTWVQEFSEDFDHTTIYSKCLNLNPNVLQKLGFTILQERIN